MDPIQPANRTKNAFCYEMTTFKNLLKFQILPKKGCSHQPAGFLICIRLGLQTQKIEVELCYSTCYWTVLFIFL
jgi:hypothetical protein